MLLRRPPAEPAPPLAPGGPRPATACALTGPSSARYPAVTLPAQARRGTCGLQPGPRSNSTEKGRLPPVLRRVKLRPTWGAFFLALTLVLAGPQLSWGHPVSSHTAPPPLETVHEPAAPDPAPLVPLLPFPQADPGPAYPSPLSVALFFLTAFGLAGAAWRWRKAAALSFALVLGFFAFQTAFHSVHHLSDPQKGAQCPVFSASQHVIGDSPSVVALEIVPVDSISLVSGSANSLLPDLPLRPDQGRAPPSLLA